MKFSRKGSWQQFWAVNNKIVPLWSKYYGEWAFSFLSFVFFDTCHLVDITNWPRALISAITVCFDSFWRPMPNVSSSFLPSFMINILARFMIRNVCIYYLSLNCISPCTNLCLNFTKYCIIHLGCTFHFSYWAIASLRNYNELNCNHRDRAQMNIKCTQKHNTLTSF